MMNVFLGRIRENLKLFISYSPTGVDFKQRLRKYKQFLLRMHVIWHQELSPVALANLGRAYLKSHDSNSSKLYSTKQVLGCCVKIFDEAREASRRYFDETGHTLYFSTTSYIDLFKTF